MDKEIFFMPKCVKKFKCIAGACEDTCCSGWDIAVDENTFNKYIDINDDKFKKLLEGKLIKHKNENTHLNYGNIVLKDNFRCSFLDDEGLCDIHGNFGEEHLCITCTNFPRVVNVVDEVYEKTLLLSCPEAARLILLNPKKIEFIEYEENINHEKVEIKRMIDTYELSYDNIYMEFFWEIRECTINILQDRKYDIDKRIYILELFYKGLIECDEMEQIEIYIEQFTSNMLELNNYLEKTDDDIIRLIEKLAFGDISKIHNNDRLLECIEEFKKGLDIENGINKYTIEKYKQVFEESYIRFMKKKEYIYENYLVSYVFKELFPFNKDNNFRESIKVMRNIYDVLKIYLLGISGYYKEKFSEKDVVKLIQSLSKTIEHNIIYRRIIEEII